MRVSVSYTDDLQSERRQRTPMVSTTSNHLEHDNARSGKGVRESGYKLASSNKQEHGMTYFLRDSEIQTRFRIYTNEWTCSETYILKKTGRIQDTDDG